MKHGLTRKATADEIHQLRSVTQCLAWIASPTRPDLSYRISKIQSTFENACVRDLRECNRIVENATSTSTCGFYFSPFFWERCNRRDNSWRQFLPRTGANRRSHSELQITTGLYHSLGSLNAEKMLIHPLSWRSTRIRRVCRCTLMAEAYALSNAVEHGLPTRATIVDIKGQLNIRQREEAASAAMGHVWFADCESLFAHVISPNTKQADNKRPAIDLLALKQLNWENRDDCDKGSKGEYPRWIDTSAMLSDCLAKRMTSGRLNETLSTCIFVIRPTEESLAIKAKKQEVESVVERAGTVPGFRYLNYSLTRLLVSPISLL